MDSRNSWIDRREIAELLRQLLPDAVPSPQPPAPETASDWDDPISLLADQAPEWDDPSTAPLHRSESELRQEALRSLNAILPFTTGSFSPADASLPSLPSFPPAPSPPCVPGFHPPRSGTPQSSAPSPPPGAPEFHMPSGSLTSRLRAFSAWVASVTGSTRLLITDSQGYSLLESDAPEDASAVGSALQLIEALEKFRLRMQHTGARSGLYLPVSPTEWFGVVECESSLGPVCLSLLIPAPLSAAAAQELARVLRLTLEA